MDDLIASFAAGNHSQRDNTWSDITPFPSASATEDLISKLAASEIYSWKDNAVQLDPFNLDDLSCQLDDLYGRQIPPKRISMASKNYVGITSTSESVFHKLLRLDFPEHGLPELRHGTINKLLREHMSFWNQERTNVHRKSGAVFCWSTSYKKQKSKERILLSSPPSKSSGLESPRNNNVLLSSNIQQSPSKISESPYKPTLNDKDMPRVDRQLSVHCQSTFGHSSSKNEDVNVPLPDTPPIASDNQMKITKPNNTEAFEAYSPSSNPEVETPEPQDKNQAIAENIELSPSRQDPTQITRNSIIRKNSDKLDEGNSMPSTEWGDWMSAKTDSSRNFESRQSDLLVLSSNSQSENKGGLSEKSSEHAPSLL
ncbi:uncharacterized protein SOCG_04685 [Schizosaccharomyces octosporus yFS286]|uniref:Uncharacterized protein n=1 Tax=Schizosaccharomyces octosporus (strain yFS286) TaxID=483514 RepID=S9PMP2_SCHOY|nr:uncharacterized protein SOCG_04685 [Schizosaccharomyces octosporus yFS286]EPX70521.1 hypothetical protein SOCG_04685 [Schizosaccharomyces octosporus yFS286]